MTAMQLDNAADSTINIEDYYEEESSSIKYKKTYKQGNPGIKLPNPSASNYRRSDTNNSNMKSGLRHEGS